MFNFNNAGEAEDPEEVEEEVESDDNTETPPTTNDPYDAITDPEARAEAKRLRAIHNRQERKERERQEGEEKAKDEAPSNPANYATKDDLKLMATNAAKEKVAPEVKELWDELVAIPLGGFYPLSAESIAANMNKRFNLYKLEHPDASDDPTKVFTSSPDVSIKGGDKGGTKGKEPEVKLPGYKEPIPPSQWY